MSWPDLVVVRRAAVVAGTGSAGSAAGTDFAAGTASVEVAAAAVGTADCWPEYSER